MYRYIIKRIIMLIPIILGVTFFVFMIINLSPGDPTTAILGDNATQESINALREELGLNDPLLLQYVRYISNLVRGDLGTSYITQRSVFKEIASKFPYTLALTTVGMIIAIFISIPAGIMSATKQYSLADRLSMIGALLGMSIPNFWLGLMLILLFALHLRWLPSGGAESIKSIILPALSLGVGAAANITRMTRSSMLEVIRQDYIRTAKSKGIGRKAVIRKHALKNALIPVVTIIGLQFGSLLGGMVFCETVFSWPGLGRLLVDAVRSKDTPQILGSIVVFAIGFSIINLLIDILYGYLDPRIKAQYKR